MHVTEVEAQARRYIESEYGTDIQLIDNLTGEISLGCALIDGSDHDRGVGFLQLVLFSRALNALRRAREDIVTGYAAQALTLARSAYEDWGTICYVDNHPAQAEIWTQHMLPGVPATTTAPPTFGEIWRELSAEVENAGALYGLLCEFAHPRVVGFAWLVRYEEGSWQFTVGPQVEERQVLTAVHHTMLVVGVLASRVPGLQERLLGGRDEAWWQRIWPLMEQSRARAEANHARLSRLLGVDLNDVDITQA